MSQKLTFNVVVTIEKIEGETAEKHELVSVVREALEDVELADFETEDGGEYEVTDVTVISSDSEG